MARPSKYDWEEIRNAYECGKEVDELVSKYGVTKKTLQNKISQQLWEVTGKKMKPFSLGSGFVYLMEIKDSADKYFYKIGYAKNPKSRLSDVQTGNPFQINLKICFYVENMRDHETVLHKKFKKKKMQGEWYALSDLDILEIKKHIVGI